MFLGSSYIILFQVLSACSELTAGFRLCQMMMILEFTSYTIIWPLLLEFNVLSVTAASELVQVIYNACGSTPSRAHSA